MDEDTQQNTQPVNQVRSKGTNSQLTPHDEADILCFFHPASLPAHGAVELVRETAPHHVHTSYRKAQGSGKIAKENTENEPETSHSEELDQAAADQVASTDIALRMSSHTRDRRMGFVFGRNLTKCDLLMAEDSKRLSSAHFRVYVNHSGVLMLEDMSMNGTYVDHNLLKSIKANPPNHGLPSTRMLSHGSIIELPVIAEKNEEWIRFIILFPTRKNGEDAYQSNLVDYIQWIKQDERKNQIARAAGGLLPPARPMPFTPLQKTARNQSPPVSNITAATGQNNHGMKWNGGETYNVVGYIGQGAFAMVYKLSTVQHGTVYACKQIEKRRFVKDGQPGNKMHHEISIMKSISHPSIVQFVDYHETSRHMFIVMEYVPLGDLTLYTNDHMMMYEHMGQHVAAQICQALKYLHQQKIAHRDIKPDNILIASHSPFEFKLSDFGLSKVLTNEDNMRTFCGTILYCAPEIYPGYERAKAGMPVGKRGRHIQHPREVTQPYYYSVDTWGIAAVLFHLLSGQPAWAGTTDDNGAVMLENIFSKPIDWERLTLAGLSDLAVDFVRQMLQIDPADRATDEEVLAHPWIKAIVLGKPAELREGDEADNDNVLNDDDEELPDASQLEINDRPAYDDVDQITENEHNGAVDANSDSLPHDARTLLQANNRLFGEIPESALRSSGVLGENINQALGIDDFPMDLGKNHKDDFLSESSGGANEDNDNNTNEVPPLGGSYWGRDFGNRVDGGAYVRMSDVNRERGAENDLDYDWDNNYDDDGDDDDCEDTDEDVKLVLSKSHRRVLSKQAKTAVSSQAKNNSSNMSAARQAKRSIQYLEATNQDASTKRSRTGYETSAKDQAQNPVPRKTELAHASRHWKDNRAEESAELREEASDHGTLAEDAKKTGSSQDKSKYLSYGKRPNDGVDPSFPLDRVSKSVSKGRQGDEDPGERFMALLRSGKWKNEHPKVQNTEKAEFMKNRMSLPNPQPPPILANTGPNLNTVTDESLNLKPYDLETPMVLGVLTPVWGSIPTVPAITITNRTTTFGRDPKSTFVHPGNVNTDNWGRIGKYCIDLTFWYRNIEKEIDDQTLPSDWYENPELVCLISTRTSRYILINGERLTKSPHSWAYGKLRTGDIITVVEPDPNRVPTSESETKALRFRCEFFTGASKNPRPLDHSDPFTVLDERAEWRNNLNRLFDGHFRECSAAPLGD